MANRSRSTRRPAPGGTKARAANAAKAAPGGRTANGGSKARPSTESSGLVARAFGPTLRMQLLVALPVAAVVRLWLAVVDHGVFWPDAIFQTVEPGHHLAFGYGFKSWEFQSGIRSWALPGLLAGYLKVVSLLGFHSGLSLMIAVKVLLALLGVAALAAAMWLAWRVSGPTASLIAAAIGVFFPVMLVYGNHSFSETFAAPLVVVAVALVARSETTRRDARLAAVAAALSAVIRPQNALFVVGVLVVMLLRSEKRPAIDFAAVVGGVAVLAGILDWITWGEPFASYWRYYRAGIKGGSLFTTQPWYFFLTKFVTANSVLALIVVVGLLLALRRVPGFVVIVFAFVFAHSLVAHKELRFIYPIVPLAVALASIGLGEVIDSFVAMMSEERNRNRRTRKDTGNFATGVRTALVSGGVVIALLFGLASSKATFGGFGETRYWASGQSVYHNLEGYNRLLSTAGRTPSICGLGMTVNPVWIGGYSYLHRDIPAFSIKFDVSTATVDVPRGANAVLMDPAFKTPAGFTKIASSGVAVLIERKGGCGPPPRGYTRDFPRS